MADFIKIHSADNVAVAISNIEAEDGHEYIPAGHKMALCDLQAGADVIKYGFPIGHLTKAVAKGDLIDHTNPKTNIEGLLEYNYQPELVETAPAETTAFFKGYRRADGRAGVRNELWIIPTVGCVNGVAQSIRNLFEKEMGEYPSIGGSFSPQLRLLPAWRRPRKYQKGTCRYGPSSKCGRCACSRSGMREQPAQCVQGTCRRSG